MRELDGHKNIHSSSHIRERAHRILKKIERWIQGEQVRPGISMEFLSSIPVVDYHKLELDPNWGDDRLIASILYYVEKSPGIESDSVVLVTQDSGPRITASRLGIRILELPEEYRLPAVPDPKEAELRELRQENLQLKSAKPALNVSFASPKENQQHANFTLPRPLPSIKDQIVKKIEELKTRFPKQYPPQKPSSSITSPSSYMEMDAQRWFASKIDFIPPEEYKRYNQEVEDYLINYKQYMMSYREMQEAQTRRIRFQIGVWNTGTAPAEDVDVELYFPDGFQLCIEIDLPDMPEEPLPPKEPRTKSQIMMEGMNCFAPINFTPPSIPDITPPSSFSIERIKSFQATDHFDRIKHNDKVVLPEMFLTFDSYDAAHSFACQYSIKTANLQKLITGKLNFVIYKENPNKDISKSAESNA